MKLQELASHLLSLDPQRDPGRLAFYHYIKNFRNLNEELSPEVVESFYHRAMQFQHWVLHSAALGQSVAGDLNRILFRHGLGDDFRSFLHAHERQWLELAHPADFRSLLAQESEALVREGQDVRLIDLPGGETLRIRLVRSVASVKVEIKAPAGFLHEGKLKLLQPLTELTYDKDLELARGVVQVLRLTPQKVARFYIDSEQAVGIILQGSSFAKVDSFRGPLDRVADTFYAIDKVAEVFWAIKSLEKYFINPVTDRHYVSILTDIENAMHSMKFNHPNSELLASEALQKAELYQERVFGDDKVLNGLIANLKLQFRRGEPTSSGRPVTPPQSGQKHSHTQVSWINPRQPDLEN